jgi:hypothetical protein
MPDPVETAELLDVDVDEVAGTVALIAANGLGRIKVTCAAQPRLAQDAAVCKTTE